MTFVPLAGGLDLTLLLEMGTKVGQYVIIINDAITTGRRICYAITNSFRKVRKLWEQLLSSVKATVYCHTGVVELASFWQGVVWKKNPIFNGQ